jgi:hypothetical protein
MRPVFRVMVRWALSPVGTLLNTGMLATLLLLRGAQPGEPLFWLPVAIFFGVAAFYDITAYLAQRRKGLTATEVADAVFDWIWSPAKEEEKR